MSSCVQAREALVFRMVPESYKMALASLDMLWQKDQSESLAIMLGGMSLNPNNDSPMDPGCLDDWQQISAKTERAEPFELMMAFLDLEAIRYKAVPEDLVHLIAALRTEGSPEHKTVESVMASWPEGYDQSALYTRLTKKSSEKEP